MRFHIENFGCQMNEHDMAKMTSLLVREGYAPSDSLRDADLVIVNTCSVREKAEQKFYSFMGRLRIMKKRRGTLLGVTGCIAQQEKDIIAERLPFVDFSLGTGTIHRVADAVREAMAKRRVFDFSENGCTASLDMVPGNIFGGIKAFVTIMKGCNNFCSYCVVPYVRGREASRPSADIIEEVRVLVREGVQEVTLLGQNVNSYNRESSDISFAQLLHSLDAIDGLERLRFVTSHPKDLSDDLIACFGSLRTLCGQIHLPFQSGSDRILALMNRKYSIAEYREKVARLRRQMPEIAITADCIVGFPGEEKEDFEQTLELVRAIELDGIFSFVYSPRKFTAAQSLGGDVPRGVALDRLADLQKIQKTITLKKNRELEGTIQKVLVEDTSKGSSEDLTGRTTSNKVVNFRGSRRLIGKIVEVAVTQGYANSLRGKLSGMKEDELC